MKKALILLGIVLSFFLVSCADEPLSNNVSLGSSTGNIEVSVSGGDVSGSLVPQDIIISPAQVTQAVITLVAPGGGIQTQTWRVGGANVFYFTASVTGLYTIGVRETDRSNNVTTNGVSTAFQGGYNYYISISLGGNIVVTVGSNGGASSSVSSSSSSVSSSSSSTSSSSSSTPPAGGATFGIFSESVSNMITFGGNAAIDIWNGMTLTNNTNTVGDGTVSWKITGTDPNGGWMGMGIRVNPTNNYRNMTAFANGSLRVMFRGSKGFKLGLKSNETAESWLTVGQLMAYGLQTNNTWCTLSVPVPAFTGVDMSIVSLYFALVADSSTGYRNGDVFNIDNIYFTTNATPLSAIRTFGLYTEIYPVNVVWNTSGMMDLWSGFDLISDSTNAGDGGASLRLTINTNKGAWSGFAMRVNPLDSTGYKNLSAFVGGNLKFMYRSTKAISKIGVIDGNGAEAYVTGATCVSSYGMRTDGTWSTVTVPMAAFTGIDWTKIAQYFVFVVEGSNFAQGNVYNIDNIFFVK